MGIFSGKRPGDLGVKDGRLKPAPSSPNAVSSQATDAGHAIEPLRYRGPREGAVAKLRSVLDRRLRTKLITATGDYLYAECATPLFGFVDDVEFWFPPEGKIVHVRSASRVGYSDFGVNRQRVEDIRKQFSALDP